VDNSFSVILFFFQKKKQKALPLRGRPWAAQTSAKPTLGVWGRAPKNNWLIVKRMTTGYLILLFWKRRAVTFGMRNKLNIVSEDGLRKYGGGRV
jgi:hypothetical protein